MVRDEGIEKLVDEKLQKPKKKGRYPTKLTKKDEKRRNYMRQYYWRKKLLKQQDYDRGVIQKAIDNAYVALDQPGLRVIKCTTKDSAGNILKIEWLTRAEAQKRGGLKKGG